MIAAGRSCATARRRHPPRVLAAAALALCLAPPAQARPQTVPQPPSVAFEPLYAQAAHAQITPDAKQLADAVPQAPPAEIMARYREERPASPEALRAFYARYFAVDTRASGHSQPTAGLSLRAHVAELWPLLIRRTPSVPAYSSLLALPHPYVVPGGRFTEIYYWDSYFTMLGFAPEQAGLRRGMVDNFADLISTYGHIPNGNRSYYLSRSQPPFFFKMVALTDRDRPAKAFAAYLPALRAEYRFWMDGAAGLKPGEAARRVVRMPDGALLNRYWDDRDVPRDEAYRVDTEAARTGGRPDPVVYRHLRAGAESGWDYSSRWLADGKTLASVRTGDIVPPDLNSLLFGLERAIAQGCAEVRDTGCVTAFEGKAAARGQAMRTYLWNPATGLYDDYLWTEGHPLGHVTAASLYPLYVGAASPTEAASTARVVERDLLKPGGLVTTTVTSGQQWDAPNGWAPLQWIAVEGLRAYGETGLAETIATRWLTTVATVYADTGKLLEKYDVVTLRPGGGGEYPLQDGFGWTNGTAVALMNRYPSALTPRPVPSGGPRQQERAPWP
ncbi:alpha,alpha-trehalase TreF [Novosphingobium mathurense]|uniref:Alpha,alpha-trehalase n=1 Tax=Novosphingobium mathurense TaxID=428990 RepID=A0A1U6H6A0_9SPHN|nr:alpha,alpha-trehalase TreF [Novosphingobium mathurense]SLJ91267.1 alpha,alpha-trehalase [Novosphingobium mathurense]